MTIFKDGITEEEFWLITGCRMRWAYPDEPMYLWHYHKDTGRGAICVPCSMAASLYHHAEIKFKELTGRDLTEAIKLLEKVVDSEREDE